LCGNNCRQGFNGTSDIFSQHHRRGCERPAAPRHHDKEDVMSRNHPVSIHLALEVKTNKDLCLNYLVKNKTAMESIHAALTSGASKADDVLALADPRFWIVARVGRVRVLGAGSIEEIVDPVIRVSRGHHSVRFGVSHAGCDDQRNLRLATIVMTALALIEQRLQRMDRDLSEGNQTKEDDFALLRLEIKGLILSMHHQMYETAVDGLWTREAWQEAFQHRPASRGRSPD
jgi:hypothetical protein